MGSMNDCEICPILSSRNDGEDVLIAQTDKWRVVLDPNQRFLGKSFVTLLEHKESLSDLDSADWRDFEVLVKRLELAIKKAFQPNHFNWSCLMNMAAMNAQQTHVHWHIHPRYNQTIVVSGETFEDKQWYPQIKKIDHIVDKKVLQVIADKIKENL